MKDQKRKSHTGTIARDKVNEFVKAFRQDADEADIFIVNVGGSKFNVTEKLKRSA